MKENVRDQLRMRLRRAAVAAFAIGASVVATVHAGPSRTVVTSPAISTPPTLDFWAIDTVLSYELDRMFDVKQVRAQMTRSDAGMLTENGLCDQTPGRRVDSVEGDSPH
jgi:hypothetical protein